MPITADTGQILSNTADVDELELGTGGASAADILAAFKADADFGTTGLIADADAARTEARRTRQFDSNRRTVEVLSATQWRYTVYEDDATTVAYRVDYNPTTGAKAAVS